MLSVANFPAALPAVTGPIRLDDLPALLGPYAVTAPIYVYLMGCGILTASRFRLKDEEDLILVLKPRPSAFRSAVCFIPACRFGMELHTLAWNFTRLRFVYSNETR